MELFELFIEALPVHNGRGFIGEYLVQVYHRGGLSDLVIEVGGEGNLGTTLAGISGLQALVTPLDTAVLAASPFTTSWRCSINRSQCSVCVSIHHLALHIVG